MVADGAIRLIRAEKRVFVSVAGMANLFKYQIEGIQNALPPCLWRSLDRIAEDVSPVTPLSWFHQLGSVLSCRLVAGVTFNFTIRRHRIWRNSAGSTFSG
jgi:hypothetical protein